MPSVTYQHFTGTAAENYQRDFVPLIATPVSKDLMRAADLQPGERVLDVACGTGVISRLASERVGVGGSVTAIDIAPDMIDVAKSVATPEGAKIDWRIADAASLPIPDASVDVVLCQMGLMFMENRAAAVAEMHRVLAPSGRLAINTPGRIQPVYELMERAMVEHISTDLGGFVSAVFSMHDPEAVAELLAGAGLREVSAGRDVHVPPAGSRRVPVDVHQPHADGGLHRQGPSRCEGGPGEAVRRGRATLCGRSDNCGRAANGVATGRA